jgi:endoglucanase
MDWVLAGSGGVRPGPAPAQFAAGNFSGLPMGSYDAIRVYLWLGIADRATPGVGSLLDKVSGMSSYMAHHVTPPLRVDGSGKVVDANAPVGFSAALVPYLFATGMKAQANDQLNRMGAMQDRATGLYGHDAMYYDQNLALFGMGWNDQRYRFDRDGRLKVKWR